MIGHSISVTLNGELRELAPPASLASLLEVLGIDRRLVAVALNGDVVTRANYDATAVHDGDRIEVVRMVGGG